MAAYPSFGQTTQSKETVLDNVAFERSTNGTLRGRRIWSSRKRQFSVHHILSDAQKAELDSFYDTNAYIAVTFTWQANGTTWSCCFKSPPDPTKVGRYWSVKVALEEE